MVNTLCNIIFTGASSLLIICVVCLKFCTDISAYINIGYING
jgi:hypothetical protein